MALFYVHKERGITRDITITGVPTVGANDVLRARVQAKGVSYLEFTSAAASGNGSTFTKNAGQNDDDTYYHRLRLDAQDLTFAAGTYEIVIELFDSADTDEWKIVDRQVFVLEGGIP